MSLFPGSFQKNVSERIVSFRILFKGNIIEKVEGTTADLLAGERIVCQARICDKWTLCKMVLGICMFCMVILSLLNTRKEQNDNTVKWNIS